MRTKTRSAKRRFCKSSKPSSPATATASRLPSPTPDYSSNAEESADRISMDKSSQSDGVETNVVDEVKLCEEEDDMNWLGEKICLKCNMGGQLLFCSEIACPTALHEECIVSKPSYDEEGKFYCPFCWYKLQMIISEELRKKAMLAKKALEDFLECKPTQVGDDKEKKNDGTAKGNGSNGITVTEERKCNINLNSMGQEKDNRQIDNEQDEEIFEDEEQTESLNAHCVEEETIIDSNVAFHGSAGAKSETLKAPEGNQVREEKQEMHKDAPEAKVSYTGGDATLDEPEMSVSDTETLAVRIHSVRQRKNKNADSPETSPLHQNTNSAEEVSIQNDEVSPLKRSPKKSPIHGQTTSAEEAGNQNDDFNPLIRLQKKSSIHPPSTASEEAGNQKKKVNRLKKSRESEVHVALDEPEMSVSDTETLAVRIHSVRQRKNKNTDLPETSPLHQNTNSAEVSMQNDEASPLKRSPKKSPIHGQTTSAEEAENQNDEVNPLKRPQKKSSIHPPSTVPEEAENQNKKVNRLKKSRESEVHAALDEPEMSVSDTETLAVRIRSVRQRKNKNADSPETSPLHQNTNSAEEVSIQNDEVSPLKRSPKKSPIHGQTTSAEEAENQNDKISPLKRSRKKSSIHPTSTASEEAENQNKKVNHLKKSRESQDHAKKVTNRSFAREKRKRMHWTPEEEEMLREGVHKFSTEVNKNIPWRKILDFGRHIFDGSRTPADLKDKWRNIVAKES